MKPIVLILCTLFIFSPQLSLAKAAKRSVADMEYMPPKPPKINPHEPQTELEKKIVAVALQSVNLILKNDHKKEYTYPNNDFMNKTAACLNRADCLLQDKKFLNEVYGLQEKYGLIKTVKHAHIIPWSWVNYKAYQDATQTPKSTLGGKTGMAQDTVQSAKPKSHGYGLIQNMAVPDLKNDEFMVHIYVQYDKSSRWHHLDVIMSLNDKGEPVVRHFFSVPMPEKTNDLPPGVVC